jgi:hypothetical protein
MIATLMAQLGNHTNAELDENLLRHMILNSIRANKMKFSAEFGEMVIAADDRKFWRRDLYPYYKANRKKTRDASELNWNVIFDSLNKIREELKESFPYPVVQVDSAEADDVIAVLTKHYNYDKILILSGDKDFQQLQRYPNVKQYSPVLKKYITCRDPDMFLKEHIMRGDVGDGIPNFLSADATFVDGSRQKPLATKKVDAWLHANPVEFCNVEMLRNYKRNQQLVDFDFIPEDVEQNILAEYKAQSGKDRTKLFNYFISNKLKNLVETINDF